MAKPPRTEFLNPIGDTGFFTSIGDPENTGDPLDCDRWPGSPYCDGPIFSPMQLFKFQPAGFSLDFGMTKCEICISISPVLFAVALPPTTFCYRNPTCIDDPAKPKLPPPDGPAYTPGRPIESLEGAQYIKVRRLARYTNYEFFGLTPEDIEAENWFKVNLKVTKHDEELQRYLIGLPNRFTPPPQGYGQPVDLGSFRLHRLLDVAYLPRDAEATCNCGHSSEAPCLMSPEVWTIKDTFDYHWGIEDPDNPGQSLKKPLYRPRQEICYTVCVDGEKYPFAWGDNWIPIKQKSEHWGYVGPEAEFTPAGMTLQQGDGAQGWIDGEIVVEYEVVYGEDRPKPPNVFPPPPVDPPPPEPCCDCCKEKNMSCCDTEIEELLRKIANALGVDEYPVKVPRYLLSDQSSKEIELANLTRMMGWFVEQVDALAGEFPIEIEIEDNDLATKGNQKQKIQLPNLAESIAELYGLAAKSSITNDTQINFLVRLAAEAVAIKTSSLVTQDYASAIASYLGFDANTPTREVEYAFDVTKLDSLDTILANSKKKYLGFQDVGKTTVQDYLERLMFAAGLLKANLLRTGIGDLVKEIGGILGTDETTQEANEKWNDFVKALNKIDGNFNANQPTTPKVDSFE